MRIPWLKGLGIAVPASGAYYAAGYTSGNAGYAPIRHKSWVTEQMNTNASISAYKSNPKFQQLTQVPRVAELHGVDGAVSEVTMSFRDLADPQHTMTFVHCGPHTVGFPFLVHGGVLGALLNQSAELAYSKPVSGHLTVKYRNPTAVDSILKIESQRSKTGLDLFVYSAHDNKLLVEATFVK